MTQADHSLIRRKIRDICVARGWHADTNGPAQTVGRHDLTLCVDGRFVSVEIKTGRGEQTPAQRHYAEKIRHAGGVVIEARSLAQFIEDVERNTMPGTSGSPWVRIKRTDPRALKLADRHYSRRTPGSKSFVQNARSLVLLSHDEQALWVTIWPYKEYVGHAWKDAWQCSLFRNEGTTLSSDLIRAAVAETLAYYRSGENPKWKKDPLPTQGFVTFVDGGKIRKKRDPGRCFVKAGWTRLKERTGSGLTVLQLPLEDITQEKSNVASLDAWFQLAVSGVEAVNNLADALRSAGAQSGGPPTPLDDLKILGEIPEGKAGDSIDFPVIGDLQPQTPPFNGDGDDLAADPQIEEEKPKRRGRPKGSTNKKQAESGVPESMDETIEQAVGAAPVTPDAELDEFLAGLTLE